MTLNLKNLLNPKVKLSKMGEFQELQPIEGLEISAVSADLYGDGRDDLTLFYFENGANYAARFAGGVVIPMGSTEDWWYKTRLPELQREEELKRREKMKESVEIGKEEEPWEAVHLELKDKDFMRIAREAHKRDITINRMINIMLKDAMSGSEYRFEHGNKPR